MEALMLELIVCPDPACAAIAEIVDRVAVGSTGGPAEIVRTLCLHRHIFLLPVDRLGRDVTVHRGR
jgi:hypothetical protein